MSPAQITRVRRYRGATQTERWGSFGVSLFLHISLFAAVIYVSTTPTRQYNLDTPMLNITQLTLGASGPKPAKQPEVGKAAAPPPKAAEPEAVPVPKIEELQKQPEAVAEEPKAEEPPKPSDEDLLAAALAGAKTDAKAAPKVSGGQSLLDEALKSAGSAAKDERVITGESGTGVGAVALYEEVVAMAIRQHFTIRPHTDGRIYEVLVRVEIAANGALIKATVLRASGDPVLDSNVLRAAREAGKFEPPPGGRPQNLEIPFTSDIFAGQ